MPPITTLIGYQKAMWCRIPLKKIEQVDISGKVVVITGANSGIGAVAAQEFAQRGAILVSCCRDVVKGQKVLDEIKTKVPTHNKLDLVPLDLGDLSSVRTCASQIQEKYPKIDILVNNAGIMFFDGKTRKTKDGFEMHFGVNHLGHFLFTELLLENVKKAAPSRIVNVASMSFTDASFDVDDLNLEKKGSAFGFANQGPYANSKLANIYHANELSKRLAGTGVTTYALCPGSVKTDIYRDNPSSFLRTIADLWGAPAEQGAENILYCSIAKQCEGETGLMYRCNGVWQGVDKGLKPQISETLYKLSRKFVGLDS